MVRLILSIVLCVASLAASVDFYRIAIDDRVALSSNFLGNPGSAFVDYLAAAGHGVGRAPGCRGRPPIGEVPECRNREG